MQASTVVLPGVPDLFFPPETLREYALLADGERGALIGPRGDVAFLCAPRWDDDAVFSNLLGGRGSYVIRPVDDRFGWDGSNEAGSLVWRSRWVGGRPGRRRVARGAGVPGATESD